ncbi:MAG TPA: hypothetical protein VFC73_05275 [Syntrophomonadaceae bacterium]|nr:hypothetical protein [Syntrophomonadaceae bacterium]
MKKFYILPLALIIVIVSLFNSNISIAANVFADKKAVLIIMDYIDTKDLTMANTPHLETLVQNSGTGLMNIRSKNLYPSSAYMSIAVGYRVGTINGAELSFNTNEKVKNLPNVFETDEPYWSAGELYSLFTNSKPNESNLVNLYAENIKKNSIKYNPPYEMGQIGKIAKNNNLSITVLGNSDTVDKLNRNAAILGMDENGLVLQGDISSKLYEYDSLMAGGTKTDHDVLLEKIESYLPSTNLFIIDLGDTTRVEMSRTITADHIVLNQRKMAIERNDEFFGQLLPLLDQESTMLIILTPNPNKDMLKEKNFGLTPVIIYDPTQSDGLLSSTTTRRPGLITNLDILPTIFSYLEADFTAPGANIHINKVDNNSIEMLDEELQLHKNLRTTRNPLHILLISLILLAFAIGLWVNYYKSYGNNKYVNILINCVLSIPFLWMFISMSNYTSLAISLLITLIGGLFVGGVLYLLFRPIDAILVITGATSILLTLDCYLGSKLMLLSPLGSDAIAGGRYYGVGNDFMGILLASSVVFTTLILSRINIKTYWKALLGFAYLLIVSNAIGNPSFGANVGGLITSLVTAGVFVLFITDRKINLNKLFIVLLLAVISVVSVAQLDALFSTNPSHAGKAINSLLTGGPQVFFSILRTKLGILGNTIYSSHWSVVMLVSAVFLIYSWIRFKEQFAILALKAPSIMMCVRILIISGITVFLVNDTGVIASALIFTYAISCFWVGISEI